MELNDNQKRIVIMLSMERQRVVTAAQAALADIEASLREYAQVLANAAGLDGEYTFTGDENSIALVEVTE